VKSLQKLEIFTSAGVSNINFKNRSLTKKMENWQCCDLKFFYFPSSRQSEAEKKEIEALIVISEPSRWARLAKQQVCPSEFVLLCGRLFLATENTFSVILVALCIA